MDILSFLREQSVDPHIEKVNQDLLRGELESATDPGSHLGTNGGDMIDALVRAEEAEVRLAALNAVQQTQPVTEEPINLFGITG